MQCHVALSAGGVYVICLLLIQAASNPLQQLVYRLRASSGSTSVTAIMYDQFVLFGDSLLQHSSSQERGFALAPALQAGKIEDLSALVCLC